LEFAEAEKAAPAGHFVGMKSQEGGAAKNESLQKIGGEGAHPTVDTSPPGGLQREGKRGYLSPLLLGKVPAHLAPLRVPKSK